MIHTNRQAYARDAAAQAAEHLSQAVSILESAARVTAQGDFDQVVYDLGLLKQQVEDIAERTL